MRARIFGGLGNQLFQYAAGLAVSMAWDADLQLDLTGGDRGSLGHPRRFMLNGFSISAPLYAPAGGERLYWKFRTSRHARLRRLAGMLPDGSGLVLFDEEKPHRMDERFAGPPPGRLVSMVGYWQSAAMVGSVREQLTRELAFRPGPDEANAALLGRIRGERNAIAVHVRRGDYLHLAGSPVLPARYYRDAVDLLAARLQDPVLYIFSDTPQWARANLPFDQPTVFVENNGEDAALEDLRLMAACRHHVIANSSFSWWGAWLGQEEGQMVVAPRYWMMRRDTFHPGLFPATWHVIDNLA